MWCTTTIKLLVLFLIVDIHGTKGDWNLGDLFKGVGIQTSEYSGGTTAAPTNTPTTTTATTNTNIITMTTNKRYLLVGEYLFAQCILTPEELANGMTSSHLSIGRTAINGSPTSPIAPRKICFDDSQIDRPTTDTATLNISVTPEMAGVYSCFKTLGCPPNDTIRLSDDISVEYAPQEVINFSCVVLNWDSMECSWKDPVAYVDPGEVQVNLTYAEGKRPTFMDCPSPKRHKCVWKRFTQRNHYKAKVTVTNMKRNVSVQSISQIDANTIVKLNPVEDLVVTSSLKHPGCLNLQWTHSKKAYVDTNRVVFRIKLHAMDEKGQVEDSKVLVDNLTRMDYDACGFHAYTRLHFSVDAYPAGPLFSGYWSEPVDIDGWTPEEVPASGPTITMGSFVVNKTSETEDFDITVYWNQVAEPDRNGIIDSYRINSPDGKLRTISNDSRSLSTTLVVPHNLANPFTVNISAHNSAGYSKTPSRWHIDPTNFRVPEAIQGSFVAKIEKEDLVLNWENAGGELYNVTIYWCYGSSPIGNCENHLNWRQVGNASDSHYVIPRLPLNRHKYYSYGVSVSKANTNWTSGIFWTQCLIRNSTSSRCL